MSHPQQNMGFLWIPNCRTRTRSRRCSIGGRVLRNHDVFVPGPERDSHRSPRDRWCRVFLEDRKCLSNQLSPFSGPCYDSMFPKLAKRLKDYGF